MRIGFVIARIGGVDGVALETEKWIAVLERMGHEVRVLSGALEGEVEHVELLPELALDHPETLAGQEKAFFGAPADATSDNSRPGRPNSAGLLRSAAEAELMREIGQEAETIRRGIAGWIEREGVECVVPENATALPCHLSLGLALRRLFEQLDLPVVAHEHDFYWERGDRYETPYERLRGLIVDCFPPALPSVRHAVINSAAKETLAERCGIEGAVVVPNVMDFAEPFGAPDDYNAHLPSALGLGDDDTLLFQITRIVRRKGIETAIELVRRLGDPKVKLVITGTSKDDHADAYYDELQALAQQRGLSEAVRFAGDRFDNRRRSADGGRIYSLSDGYARAAACTYFSTYEGFGNAFVEAVVARRPIFVNNYEPVYWPDIGSLGFETVMIEGGRLTDEAVDQAREVLADADLSARMVERNFELGREHFSYEALERIFEDLFGRP